MRSVATVQTDKAGRYLKALVNHFSRKVSASYEGDQGTIAFGFGTCLLQVDSERLGIHAESDSPEDLERVEQVLGSHLIRFTQDEKLLLTWTVVRE